jgi:transketolase
MPAAVQLSPARLAALGTMAQRLRRHSLVMTGRAGSGHPTSCLSCAEIVSVVFFHALRFDVANPRHPGNDRFVLSKGHASPILWAAWAEAGAFPVERLSGYRRFDSDLEGHPTPRNPWVDVATGSLGQGLSLGAGMAVASRFGGIGNRIFVLLGDGEVAEGSVWEAAEIAAHYRLHNLIAILDANRLGQSGPTRYGHDLEPYARQFAAFGWRTWTVDGHDVGALVEALDTAMASEGTPSIVIARTRKGRGVFAVEDREEWHGKPLLGEDLRRALEEVGGEKAPEERLAVRPLAPEEARRATETGPRADLGRLAPPEYAPGAEVATRKAYGAALEKLGAVHPRVVALDGDVKNSTMSEGFARARPERFVEGYIAEQNMIGMAAGLARMGWLPFVSSFAAFHTRAADFLRMAAISNADLKICGSHAGVSIGEDGPSQMGLEDLAMFRALPGSTILYPADAVAAERLVALAVATPGIVYLRTTRPATPVLYGAEDWFTAGGSAVLRSSPRDRATVVAAGITLHEALAAHALLARAGLAVRVIDLYSVKPVDQETLRRAVRETHNLVTVEDHYAEGGLGDAVCAALAGLEFGYRRLAVSGLPRSGTKEELLSAFGLDAAHIVAAVRELVGA